ncbi:MAG: PTS glucose transporter subunit IIA [Lachnospiraceae bacterium]|nr:PTS glucose transporter subunit IIA [Lachnospiraceae bacterium]
MLKFLKKENKVVAVATGKMVPLESVNDDVFSKKVMGDGVAFVLEDGEIVSPCDGVISMLFSTGHAFGVTRNDGVEFLIHIGIDTVNLNGEGFTILKKEGSRVKAGEPVVRVNYASLEKKGYSTTTMLIVTDPKNKNISFVDCQHVKAGQSIQREPEG